MTALHEFSVVQPVEEERNPCNPSPCGANAICKERNGVGSCACLPEYFGDPYTSCRPECVTNSDCSRDKSCTNNKCRDPCVGTCGINTECRVNNHAPSCTCLPGYSGNPAIACHIIQEPSKTYSFQISIFLYVYMYNISDILFIFPLAVTEAPFRDPCQPSPCGPYSQCRVINGHAVCSCQANYIGSPPACRPECMVSADCPQISACINQKCQDPCPGTCGVNARCQVVNHNPICSCSPGYTGEPFVRCIPEESKLGHYPALSLPISLIQNLILKSSLLCMLSLFF